MTKFKREAQGEYITIQVCLAYPGSQVSDIYIGDKVYHIENNVLANAMVDKDHLMKITETD